MKTSIKLLLIFVGIVGMLVLASDVVLWAYFKKGINGDGQVLKFPQKGDNMEMEKMADLRPFKAIVSSADHVRIMNGTENRIGNYNDSSNYFKQVGDTLYILPVKGGTVSVYCQSVQYIRLAKDSLHVAIVSLKQPSLAVNGLDKSYVEMTAPEIGNFSYKGGKNNSIVTNGAGNLDTMDVQLGTNGSVYVQDQLIKNFRLKADSMKGLRLDEIAMLKLEQFKRN